MRVLLAIFSLTGIALAASNPCSLIPPSQILPILGTIRTNPVTTLQLPLNATESKACTYGGQEYAAVVIQFKFGSPEAARAYMKSVRDAVDKNTQRSTSEKFDTLDGFSYPGGMFALKNNYVVKVNVTARMAGAGGINVDLTRQILLLALKAT